MDKKKKVLNLIIEQGILPIFFHPDAKVSLQVLKALYKGGIRAVEYSNHGEVALKNFLELRKVIEKELPGLQIGVGSIKNNAQATEFVNEGADFIVAAGVIEEVADIVHRNDLLWIPGCMTTTEIIIAEELDAELINIFPGILLGPSYIADIKETFPDLLFMATGGVEAKEENIREWFTSGLSAVGLGQQFISRYLMESKDFTAIETLAMETLILVRRIKTL